MSRNLDRSSDLENLLGSLPAQKRALLAELLDPSPEPIAVIGMACRFPQADSPEEFWRLLSSGENAACDVPPDRWDLESFYDERPGTVGKAIARQAAFLDDIASFDAQFFGITPREASRMDPQHRLLLEVSWEALERAGVPAEQLEESETGVFVGITGTDYWWLQIPDITRFDGHAGMGGAHCIASGRLSHVFNLRGPNAAVDTACSSSLVAVHMACQSLRTNESDLAIAGGVNVMAAPHGTVFLSQWGALAPDGRCKTFDASADGFGRGEGCGMVVLKRCTDALADNDPIIGVIRGSAVNQDGRSTRLSAPNGLAQEAVIRKALRDARVQPAEISYVETHGTGTPVGDPIEVEALVNVLRENRDANQVCSFGSAKANVGHLESAAGVAGLMKAILCLQNESIPGNTQLKKLNSEIHIEGTAFDVPKTTQPWPQSDKPRFAGISSFGLSGTNAHVIVGEAPAAKRNADAASDSAQIVPISARSEAALKAAARLYAEQFADPANGDSLRDLAYTASARRSHHPYRAAVAARSKNEAAELLRNLAGQDDLCQRPIYGDDAPRTAFIFSGQGSQWVGMGRQLLADEPTCRDVLLQCDEILRDVAGWSLIQQLECDENNTRFGETEIVQPTLFSIQVAIFAFLNSVGVRPDVVAGHSAGEIAAAYAAGAFDLSEAIRIVHHRARLMQRVTGKGRMAAIGLSADELSAELADIPGLCVAAINGPQSTVVSGEAEPLQNLLNVLDQRGVFCRDLGVDYAFHSPQLDPLLDELRGALAGVQAESLSTPMISTVTGEAISAEALTADHWVDNMRRPVLFAAAIGNLIEDGRHLLLEIGPRPVLATPMLQCSAAKGGDCQVAATVREGQDESLALRRCLVSLYEAGYSIDWESLFEGASKPNCVALPSYPWRHQRYWLDSPPPKADDFAPRTTDRTEPVSAPASQVAKGEQTLAKYYDQVSDMPDQEERDGFLTFAPFLEKQPGFSWVLTFHDPDSRPAEAELIRAAQKQLRDVLFRGIDFQAIQRVLDFGCGNGNDILRLAEQFPHLKLAGYTISPKQAELGNLKARQSGCQDRVAIYHRDSSKEDFPESYDLVFGFEVAHYIKDKHLLFSNIDRHLNDSGFLVLADFIANTVSPIDHDATSSFIITTDQWVELLSDYKLRVVENVDVSQEMSNFLYDPDSDANLEYLSKILGEETARDHFGSYDGLGRLFEKKLATYALMTIQKDPYLSRAELVRVNRERLSQATPYRAVVEREGLESSEPAKPESSGKNWLYEIEWCDEPLASSPRSDVEPGTWFLIADEDATTARLAELLQSQGQTCITVRAGDAFADCGTNAYELRLNNRDDFRALFADALGDDVPECRGVINLLGLSSTPAARTTLHSLRTEHALLCESLLAVLQAVDAIDWREPPRTWLVTRNARECGGDRPAPPRVAASSAWGLGRTAAAEQPRLWGGMIDLEDGAAATSDAAAILDELLSAANGTEVAVREGRRRVPRLKRATAPVDDSNSWRSDATYLLTGGLGDLGMAVASRLADQGVKHLALLQRSPLPSLDEDTEVKDAAAERRINVLRDLASRGVTVRAFAADVAREDQVAEAIDAIRAEMPVLRGVIHAAGVLDDGALGQLDGDRIQRVAAPKVLGAWNLHRLTLSDPLDVFVMFSSAASLLGSPGQGNYAAANAGLDGLAHLRRQQGLPALSINWGPWAEIGMAAADPLRGDRVAELGILSIPPQDGVRLLEQLIDVSKESCAPAQVGVVALDIERLKKAWPAAAAMPLLANIVGAASPSRETPANAASQAAANGAGNDGHAAETASPAAAPSANGTSSLIRAQVLAAAAPENRKLLNAFLVDETAKVLQMSSSDVDMRRPLNRMGIDSLMAVELRNRIESEFNVAVQLVRFLEGATLDDLAASVLDQLSAATDSSDSARVAEVVEQLAQMSDDEVSRLLAEKKKSAGKEMST